MIIVIFLIFLILFVLYVFLENFISKKTSNFLWICFLRFVVFFLSFLLLFISNFYLDEPLNNFISPPKANISFNPVYTPVFHDGQEKIMINYRNTGDLPLTNLVIEYIYSPFFKDHITREMKNVLAPDEEGTFYVVPPEGENLTCSFDYGGVNGTLYVHPLSDECYFTRPSTVGKCSFRKAKINVVSQELTKSFDFFYPFKGSHLWFSLGGCNEIEINNFNMSLEEFKKCPISLENIGIYPPAFCSQGLLSSNLCSLEGFTFSEPPKIDIFVCGEKVSEAFFPIL